MFKLLFVFAVIGFVAANDDTTAEVKSFHADVNEHGFDYALDTTNNIHAASSGDENGNVHGDYGWISPEGEHVEVKYVADENGYRAEGAWIPQPHPIPTYILRAIEYINSHPSQEH